MTARIFGVGIELVECARVGRLIERFGEDFLLRVFTRKEIAYCSRRNYAVQHYAARWAAKQAVLKAFGVVPGKHFCWQDLQIGGSLRLGLSLRIGGPIRDHCIRQRIDQTYISASISRFAAAACAVAMARDLPTS